MAADDSICLIAGCERTDLQGHGWCRMHYARWRRCGDPETLRTTPRGAALKFIRELVSSPPDDCVFWPYRRDKAGYAEMTHEGRMWRAHRLALTLYAGDPPGPNLDAAHNCGNGKIGCVNPAHLEWKTRLENLKDRIKHGTVKLNPEDIRAIRNASGTHAEIGKLFGVAGPHVTNIKNRVFWAWVD